MAIVFDNAASAKGTASTLTFNFTIGGGQNRLLVIGVSVVSGEVGIVHYDNRPAHFVGVQVDGTLRTYLYYIFDINLPPTAGTYSLQVFGSAGLTSIEAAAVSVSGAQQGAPEVFGQSSVANATSISTAINPLTAGAMAFDVVGTLANSITSLTASSGQTKREQQDAASSDVAISTKPFAAPGASSLGWSFNAQATKAGHIVAAWAPASGSAPPSLRDIRTAVTTIVSPGATGSQTVTGIGFKGKAAFFWGVPVQGTAVTVDAAQWLGVADAASPTIQQKCVMIAGRNGVADTRSATDRQNAISILRADNDTPVVVGKITSWTDDGFVVNFTTAAAGYVIFALVLGGADLKSQVGEATVSAGSVTGVPFSPDLGIAISADAALTASPSSTALQTVGAFDRSLNQWWVGAFQGVDDNSKKNSLLKTSGFVGQLFRSGSPAVPQVSWEARVTAINADGFTWTGTDGDGFFYLLLNFGGARAQVGTITKSTAAAPVIQKLPDPGWKPQAYLLASAVKNNQDPTTSLGCRVAIGAISGSRQRSTLRTDVDASTNADQRANDQRVLALGTTDADNPAVARALQIVSNTPELEWTPNDNQARLIGFVLIERGITDPVETETPVRLTSARSLPQGSSPERAASESVVVEIRSAINPTGYRIEHLTDPNLGTPGGWRLYYQLNEAAVFTGGTLIEIHSGTAEGDLSPLPGRLHRYTTATGQPPKFELNAPNDLVRLVRPDGFEAQQMDITIVSEPGPGDYVVHGDIENMLRSLVPGLLVEAVQLSWTKTGLVETPLGKAVTNAQGRYQIVYKPVASNDPPTECMPLLGGINLVVKALDGTLDTPGAEITRSAVVYGARVEEEVDLIVDRTANPSDSEYAKIDRQLRKCLTKVESELLQILFGIRDTAGYLDFAAKSTGLEPEQLLAYAQANLIAADINRAIPFGGTDPRYAEFGPFPAEAAFGLTRQGMGGRLADVLRVEPARFLQLLIEAMDENTIGRAFQPQLPFDATRSLTRQWSLIRAHFLSDDTLNNVAKGTETHLLSLALTEAKRQLVAAAESEYRGSFSDLVEALKTSQPPVITETEAENLLFVFETFAAAGRHMPIVEVLVDKKTARGWHTVADLSTVTRRKENGVEGWEDFALLQLGKAPANFAFPGDIFGRTPEEKATSHGRRLFETFSRQFSQTRFLSAAAAFAEQGDELDQAVQFLNDQTDFDLAETHVDRFLEENHLDPPDLVVDKVKQLQRLRRLTPDFKIATALIDANLDSATKIALIEEHQFIADREQILGGIAKAQTIYRKAKQISAEVLATLVRFHQALNQTGGAVALPGNIDIPALTESMSDIPRFARYAVLFGNLFSCASRHCQTVLSPSAYLVDLLQFAAGTPANVLLERRPDLAELELTCENTETAMPYIDLVIERLSAAIAPWQVTLSVTQTRLNAAARAESDADKNELATILNLVRAGNQTAGNVFRLTERARIRALDAFEWAIEDDAARWRILPVTPNTDGAFIARGTPQTAKNSKLLDVFPEHDNPRADVALADAVFPMNLPLELGRREIELILRQRNLTRAEVLTAFPTGLVPTVEPPEPPPIVLDLLHARARMSLTIAEEKALLSLEKAAHEYWGFTSATADSSIPRPEAPQIMVTGSWDELLSEVSIFLHRSQLRYEELLDLVATEFIQDNRKPLIVWARPDDARECNYNRFRLLALALDEDANDDGEPDLEIPSADVFRRISFFLRLWRKLGWSMQTLDRYLRLFEPTGMGNDRTAPPNVLRVAKVQQLAQLLSLDPIDVFGFLGDLDRTRSERLGPSFFDRTLLKGPPSAIGYQLLDLVARKETAKVDTDDKLENLQATIRSALGLGRTDLLDLWEGVEPLNTSSEVTNAKLSELVRIAKFARALRLSIADYYRAVEVLGITPFEGADVDAKLLNTADAAAQITALRDAGLSLELVEYLLRHVEDSELRPTVETIADVMRRIGEVGRGIEQRYPSSGAPTVQALSTLLSEVMPSEKIASVLAVFAIPTPTAEDVKPLKRYFAAFLGDEDEVDEFFDDEFIPADDGQPRVSMVFTHLRDFLVARERRQQALTLAAEVVGLPRTTADFLLTRALSTTAATTVQPPPRAVSDWESALAALNVDFERLSGGFASRWMVPLDAEVHFVVTLAVAGDRNAIALAIDGVDIEQKPLEPGADPKVIVFEPVQVRAGEIRQFELQAPTGVVLSLAARLDNGDPAPPPASWFSAFDDTSFVKLQKAALLVTGTRLNAVELDELFREDQAPPADAKLLDGLPFDATVDEVPWSRLRGFLDRLALHRKVPIVDGSLFEAIHSEEENGPPANETRQQRAARVAALTEWNAGDVDAAFQGLWNVATPLPSLAKIGTWRVLYRAITTAARLDLRVAQILDLLIVQIPSTTVARTLRESLRAKFSDEAFSAAFKAPRDELRRVHRDALVGFLTRPGVMADGKVRQFVNANDLFGHFLIDVEMEPDTQISRTRLALNSIQLFVQRVFLGLEDRGILQPLGAKKQQWEWMQNFRVWEANRKVFLYPENWIEPQLRDDKTELFTELEQELLEDDVDDDRAQKILARYVDRLQELSQLVVVGMHNAGGRVYFVARNRARPYAYYYRVASRPEGFGQFSPWVKIPLEIDSSFVAPVEVGGNLRILWPLVVEKEKVTKGNEDPNALTPMAVIRLVWSTFDGTIGEWSKPRLGNAKLIDPNAAPVINRDPQKDGIDTSRYHLRASATGGGNIQVEVIKTDPPGAISPRFLGTIAISRQGDDSAAQDGRSLSLGPLFPQINTDLINNAVHQLEGDPVDTFSFGGSSYFARVPAVEAYRMIVSDGQYFADPGRVPFLIEAGPTNLVGDIRRIYENSGLSRTVVREVKFETFGHPVMPEIVAAHRDSGAEGIMNRLTQALPTSKARSGYTYSPGGNTYGGANYGAPYSYYGGVYLGYYRAGDTMAFGITQRDFQLDFGPSSPTVQRFYPLPTVEFDYGKPFGVYNWELFFHLPMLVADRLAQEMRFEEALKWIHYVFDPRTDLNTYEQTKSWALDLPPGARFWNFLPFFANDEVQDSLFDVFGVSDKPQDPKKAEELRSLIGAWRANPFEPHLIARQRIVAYQKFTVMKYLDTLIAWGDELFRRDTFESINQATQLYVLAAELLGSRPEVIEPPGEEPRLSYRDLTSHGFLSPGGLDEFSNALVKLESFVIGSGVLVSEESLPEPARELDFVSSTAFSSLFFRIPRNERLESFWDTVADRLFKIRNSMNIDGVKRQLALFEPPIDPALLVRARAAGIDLSSALNQLSRPLPHYRYSVWMAQAKELANELKSFSSALLAALEKKDAEELALIRQDHEVRLLTRVTAVRKAQLKEAEQNVAALQERRALPLDRIEDLSNRAFINPNEAANMTQTAVAGAFDFQAGVMNTIAGALGAIPQLKIGFVSADAEFGGNHLHSIFTALAAALGTASTVARTNAALAGILGGFERRQEDWDLQIRQAKLEVKDIDAQIIAGEIRVDIATKELENHELQLEQSQEIQDFLKDKFTSRDLYQWMIGELSRTYQKVYRLAYDVAKTAERAFAFELGTDSARFIEFEYRDSLRRGLLAGEKLFFDLKRMEVAYLEQDRREFEITKAISLESINPAKLQELREKGSCEFELPELLFDLDFPGQYFRRIRAVRLTIPAVTGPYTSVSAKLSLLQSAIRVKNTVEPNNYAYDGIEDTRFVHDTRGIQSIAVGRAQDDAGLFELNFRDERYLPFEGAGVVSRWKLELPGVVEGTNPAPVIPRQFDYSSISDVVLQLSYTARDAGGLLREEALKNIKGRFNDILKLKKENAEGLVRVFSMKREFPDALHQLLTAKKATLTLLPEHFPFALQMFNLKPRDDTNNIEVIIETKAGAAASAIKLTVGNGNPSQAPTSMASGRGFIHDVLLTRGSGQFVAGGSELWKLEQAPFDTPTSPGALTVDNVEDIIFIIRYVVE